MAKKKKQPRKPAPQTASKKQQDPGAGAMTKGPRRVILAIVLGGFALIFAASFIYRMNHTLVRKMVPNPAHEHGNEQAQQSMPPGMGSMPPEMPGSGSMGGQTMPPAMPGSGMGQNGEGMGQIRELMQKMKESPNDPDVLIGISKQFLAMGDASSAGNFLQRALVADPSNIEAMTLLSMVRFDNQEYEESARLLERLVTLDPDNATHFYNLGMVEKHFLDNPEKGRQDLETALRLAGEGTDMSQRIAKELETPAHDHGQNEAGAPAQTGNQTSGNQTGS